MEQVIYYTCREVCVVYGFGSLRRKAPLPERSTSEVREQASLALGGIAKGHRSDVGS